MKRLIGVFLLLFCLLSAITVMAEEPAEPVPIFTVEELLAVAQNPSGSYILMEDLDLSETPWQGFDFCGSFDGNGHAILNVSISQPSGATATSYDGNLKAYETSFAGFFSSLRNAEVKDLQLINVRGLIDTNVPCFLGGLTGYSENSTIRGCTVTGNLELRAFDRMFGVAGIAGYGNGTIDQCTVDVTLICTDTDPNTRDEQFMGGIFATGYMDVTNCQIKIDGYCSEFGYVHNGGITGMHMQRPLGDGYAGKLTGNTITGKITFFECNTNRRAYCEAEAGEVLASRYTISGNTKDFLRDERKTYDVELRPEMCKTPVYLQSVTAPGCSTYGYTEHTCNSCGYTYRDDYTLFAHTVTQWTTVIPSTLQTEGQSRGNCDLCGKEFTRTEPVLTEEPTQPAPSTTTPPTSSAQPTEPAVEDVPTPEEKPPVILIVVVAVSATLLILLVLLLRKGNRGGKYLNK